MKKSYAVIALLICALLVLSSCKSLETRSAILRNDQGSFDLAIKLAKEALAKNPNDADAHFELGRSYSATGDMAGAYREFREASRLDPKKTSLAETGIKSNWAKHFNSGLSEYGTGNHAGAAHEFELATLADPRQIKGWLNLANVYYVMSDLDSTYLAQAYTTVDTLMAKNTKEDSEYGKVLALSGQILAKRGMKAEAIKVFQDLLLDDPTKYDVVEQTGIDFLNQRDWETGATLLEMVIEAQKKTNSETADAYYNLGAAYLNTKNYAKSAEAYQETLRLEPDNQKAMYYMCQANFQGDLLDDALLVGQEYTTKYPDDPQGWQLLGRCYSKKGMKMKAEEAMRKAQELAQ